MTAAHDIITQYCRLKTLPHVVTRLSQLIADQNTTMKDFEEVIKMDPTLVVRLLRLVNSPYYGLSQYIDSIGRAVAFVGMKNLYNIAVTDALKDLFSEKEPSSVFSRQRLWIHSAAVGICSQMLSERIYGIKGDDAYLCGILHDFGLIVEEQVTRATFIEICEAYQASGSLPDQERQRLGTDHSEIGFLITGDWGIPSAIRVAIRDHHLVEHGSKPPNLTAIIQIAEYIAGQFGYTMIPGIVTELSPALAAHVQDNLTEYRVLIDDLPAEMAKAREIYHSTGT